MTDYDEPTDEQLLSITPLAKAQRYAEYLRWRLRNGLEADRD